ncbi:MAG TPA: Glu-tRNA(Gln) amidotransferase subunit GatD [Methanocorpusculum sp.]|nr:Glu-tRNA(Gln) amidotransferase subunit GatD [Methanocorpusculum sp.]HJJ40380.1 Glu-tRNA(Gln) amidotransferase subunit GatD [Methanocorpusculum sp.]HJJ49675.1 Glu-tRNA(Gln) amidotransferase subunit GatD [Methanocorpusculum sp.]HJJ57613.1 Glu-tRNA(Gln) amidotransferase subunit GatD [Methanocorpusculum sp.]
MSFTNTDPVTVSFAGLEMDGIYITKSGDNAVVKLKSGYNICVPETLCKAREVTAGAEAKAETPELKQNEKLPKLSIISTGGTIASTVDYTTGAVSSKFTAEDILRSIPELGEIAQYHTLQPYNILSENMNAKMWQELARSIYDEIKNGSQGIIVTHGTDTLLYSAAAVSFMVNTPVPIIFVGAQRSADRPSSDNAVNAICSAKAGVSDLGEVVVCMHSTSSDTSCSLHRATRVRKNHTSRRDAFQSIGRDPVGTVSYPDGAVVLAEDAVRRNANTLELNDAMESHCGLVTYYPGMNPAVLDAFIGYRGLVISGTGLGHVGTDCIPRIKNLTDAGTTVVMTSQCQAGGVCDRVYETGRYLLDAGVIEAGSMLPEVALVKLMWVLGNAKDAEEVKELMQKNLKGEMDFDIRGEF